MSLDFSGSMCGKCLYADLSDRCTYAFSATGFKCSKGEGYVGWNSRPCSKYNPDNSSSRERQIYDALP